MRGLKIASGTYNNGIWVWVRVTIREGSSYSDGMSASLSSPGGSTRGIKYGNFNNWKIGSSGCTEDICLGKPGTGRTVTYKGGGQGTTYSKRVTVW